MANSMRQLYVDSIISFSTWYENGEKTGVLLKLSDYEQLVEDLHDLAAVAERREEDTISHEEFLADLRKDSILQD